MIYKLAVLLAFFSFSTWANGPIIRPIPNPRPIPIPIPHPPIQLNNWCVQGSGVSCQSGKLKVLVIPSGFSGQDYAIFRSAFNAFVTGLSSSPGHLFSSEYKNLISYYGQWLPNADLGSMIAGKFPTLDQTKLDRIVQTSSVSPKAVVVIYKTDGAQGVVPLSTTPSLTEKSYGIVRLPLQNANDGYITAHELNHAAMNFLDEYPEAGFESENDSVQRTNLLLPFAKFGQDFTGAISDFLGLYSVQISETLAHNGNDNISTQSNSQFPEQGAGLFSIGVFKSSEESIMDSKTKAVFEHNSPQQKTVKEIFEGATGFLPSSPTQVGPVNKWSASHGDPRLIFLDSNKNHQLHPTIKYQIEYGYYEVVWKTCYNGPIPYPCSENVWKGILKDVYPEQRYVTIDGQNLVINGLDRKLCKMGAQDIRGIDVCQRMNAIPLVNYQVRLKLPYQEFVAPNLPSVGEFFWRVRAINKYGSSPWSSFMTLSRVL